MLMSDETSRNGCLGIPAETSSSASQRVFHPLVLPGHPCCPNVVGGGWRIVGGVVVEVGFLSSCNGDLRDPLVLPQRSQVSF